MHNRPPSSNGLAGERTAYGTPLEEGTFEGIEENRKWKDKFWGVLFILAMIAMLTCSIFAFSEGEPSRLIVATASSSWLQKGVAQLRHDSFILFGVTAGSCVLAFVWVSVLRRYTRPIIKATLFLGIISLFVSGVYMIMEGTNRTSGALHGFGISTVITSIVLAYITIRMRHRLELTASVLQEACMALQDNAPAIYGFVLPGAVICYVLFAAYWLASFVYLYSIPSSDASSASSVSPTDAKFDSNVRYVMIFFLFMGFWVIGFITAVLRTTISGSISAWYFQRDPSATAAASSAHLYPSSLPYVPTISSVASASPGIPSASSAASASSLPPSYSYSPVDGRFGIVNNGGGGGGAYTSVFRGGVFQNPNSSISDGQGLSSATISRYFRRIGFGKNAHIDDGGATLISLRYALTYSFGSLALGSLVLAIFEFLNWVLTQAERKYKRQSKVAAFFFYMARCLSALCLGALQYVSRWSYVYIGIHGHSFFQGAKECFNLIARSGMDVILLDSVTGLVLTAGKLFGASLCVIVTLALCGADGRYLSSVSLGAAAIIAYSIFHFVSVSVSVATDTTFVCYLEDLERNRSSQQYCASPELHRRLQSYCLLRNDGQPSFSAQIANDV